MSLMTYFSGTHSRNFEFDTQTDHGKCRLCTICYSKVGVVRVT